MAKCKDFWDNYSLIRSRINTVNARLRHGYTRRLSRLLVSPDIPLSHLRGFGYRTAGHRLTGDKTGPARKKVCGQTARDDRGIHNGAAKR